MSPAVILLPLFVWLVFMTAALVTSLLMHWLVKRYWIGVVVVACLTFIPLFSMLMIVNPDPDIGKAILISGIVSMIVLVPNVCISILVAVLFAVIRRKRRPVRGFPVEMTG